MYKDLIISTILFLLLLQIVNTIVKATISNIILKSIAKTKTIAMVLLGTVGILLLAVYAEGSDCGNKYVLGTAITGNFP